VNKISEEQTDVRLLKEMTDRRRNGETRIAELIVSI
jgi:hypothetical protein